MTTKKSIDINTFAFFTVLFAGAIIPGFLENVLQKLILNNIVLDGTVSMFVEFIVFLIILWLSVKYFLQLWMSKKYVLSGDIKTKGVKETTITYVAWTVLGLIGTYFMQDIVDIPNVTILIAASAIEIFIFYFALKRYIPLMYVR